MTMIAQVPFYVYKITLIPTGHYYFGSRYQHAKVARSPHDDIWKQYFTSSIQVHQLITEYTKSAFSSEVIYTAFDKSEVFWKEQELIEGHYKDPLCLNQMFVSKRTYAKIFTIAGKTPYIHTTTHKIKYFEQDPGGDWIIHRAQKGTHWWLHPETHAATMSETPPGPDWIRGSGRTGKKSWVNQKTNETVFSFESPGPDWENTSSNKGKTTWRHTLTGKVCYSTDSPGPDYIQIGWTNMPRVWINMDTGETQKSLTSPGNRWQITSGNKNKTVWSNGKQKIYATSCPGPEWVKGITTRKVAAKLFCPHCSSTVDAGNFKRWHGDNCKLRL